MSTRSTHRDASLTDDARARASGAGAQPEGADAPQGDAQGQQPPVQQQTGEPGTTVADPQQRPNIRLRRFPDAQVPTGRMIERQKEGGEEGETEEVPEMETQAVYAPAVPAGKLAVGMSDPIEMPPREVQIAGWHEPRANEIISLYSDRYIAVVEKGGVK